MTKFLFIVLSLWLLCVPAWAQSVSSVSRGPSGVGAILDANPSNPTGTANTSGLMMGLGSTCTITPLYSTRIAVTINGSMNNNAANDGGSTQIRFGTGAAPGNAAALSGTLVGNSTGGQSSSNSFSLPFSVSGIITGLTLGTAIWIDLQLAATAGGTASLTNLNCNAFEM